MSTAEYIERQYLLSFYVLDRRLDIHVQLYSTIIHNPMQSLTYRV